MRRYPMNRWFSLPSLGRDSFREVMQTGIKYDKKFGFKITSETNVSRFVSVLSSILEEELDISRSCYICENPIESDLEPGRTICDECIDAKDAYVAYTDKFEAHLLNL